MGLYKDISVRTTNGLTLMLYKSTQMYDKEFTSVKLLDLVANYINGFVCTCGFFQSKDNFRGA
jgi:hypothetical protein